MDSDLHLVLIFGLRLWFLEYFQRLLIILRDILTLNRPEVFSLL